MKIISEAGNACRFLLRCTVIVALSNGEGFQKPSDGDDRLNDASAISTMDKARSRHQTLCAQLRNKLLEMDGMFIQGSPDGHGFE